MAIDQTRGRSKPTGAKYKFKVTKRKCNLGSVPTLTKIGKEKKHILQNPSPKWKFLIEKTPERKTEGQAS